MLPFQPASAFATETPAYLGPVGGMSSIHDAIAAALLQPVPLDRRHIVLARTKAIDTVSALEAPAVVDIARQSAAMLHIVLMEAANNDAAEIRRFQCDNAGFCEPSRRFWMPFRRTSEVPLEQAARITGGSLHVAGGFTEPTFSIAFRKVLDDFRRSYVLRYTPQGIARDGWHDIEVTAPRSPKSVVYARRGYAVEPAIAPAGPATVPTTTTRTPPVDVRSIGAAYERGEYSVVAAGLLAVTDPARLIREFVAAGNPWPGTPRREAAFVLDLAAMGIFSHREDARTEALKLLASHQLLVRHPLEPDPYERDWIFGGLALLQGAIRPDAAAPFLANALKRFPDEPRFLLADAIFADQKNRIDARAGAGLAIARYEKALARVEVAAEARIRLAALYLRIGDPSQALSLLDGTDMTRSTDRPLRFFHQLFRGQALVAGKSLDAAAAAYDAALAIWPGAQSARVGLMNTRLRLGDRAAAEGVAEQVQTAPADASDPWWRYWYGDYRFFDAAMARLREMGR